MNMLIKKKRDEIIDYLKDASNFKGNCNEVYVPSNNEELHNAISECHNNKTPFTVAGARTGLGGGCVPLEGAVISTEKLDRIIHIDKDNEIAFVEPGVLHGDLEEELDNIGYFLPPNPTEKNSSIGGNIATNASGSRTFKYGAMRDFVESLAIYLTNGDKLCLKRGDHFFKDDNITIRSSGKKEYTLKRPKYLNPPVKHSAGYFSNQELDLIDLFIGSEGTLGVISEIGLRITPKPEEVFGAVIFFDDYDNMFSFLRTARDRSIKSFKIPVGELKDISARLIEFYDDQALKLLRSKNSHIPEGAKSALWIEQEHTITNEDALLNKWYELIIEFTSLGDSTWIAMNEAEHREFREFRHMLPLTVNEILSRNDMRKFGTDIAVPDKYAKHIFEYLKSEIEKSGLQNAMWGHIGNSHFHANVMAKNDEELQKAHTFFDNAMAAAIRLGGTVSGEHGIGKLKKKYLLQMFGRENIEQMIAIKKALDPNNLLGRGNIFDI